MIDLTNIPARYGPLTQASNAAHLAGSTHRVMRHKKLSSTKGEAKGKFKYVSYCPLVLCPLEKEAVARPDTHPHMVCGPRTKKASARGQVWAVRYGNSVGGAIQI